jgi:hypothetical protein
MKYFVVTMYVIWFVLVLTKYLKERLNEKNIDSNR